MVSSWVKDNIDILMVSETKLDSSFPQTQFRIEGYAPPFREDIPAKIITITPLKDFEGFFCGIKLP